MRVFKIKFGFSNHVHFSHHWLKYAPGLFEKRHNVTTAYTFCITAHFTICIIDKFVYSAHEALNFNPTYLRTTIRGSYAHYYTEILFGVVSRTKVKAELLLCSQVNTGAFASPRCLFVPRTECFSPPHEELWRPTNTENTRKPNHSIECECCCYYCLLPRSRPAAVRSDRRA